MRLIDADKFILALMDASLSSVDEDTILDLVDSVPTVDAVPVVHGRWMKRRNGGTLCSRCGHYTQHKGDVLDMSEAIACPWCGAIMDGNADG